MELETNNLLWFEELQTRKKVSKIFYRYEKTFPEDERRNKEEFLSLAENPNVFIFNINNDDETVGYLVLWELDEFYFLEHFEVFEEYRNKKFGEKILTLLKEKFGKIALEIDPDFHSEISKRRLHFYERNGFEVIDKNYIQPSYGEEKPSLNLFLMANFKPENLANIVSDIYKKVYEK